MFRQNAAPKLTALAKKCPALAGHFLWVPQDESMKVRIGKLKSGKLAALGTSWFSYAGLYCGVVLLVYAGGGAGHFALPEGRETLIVETLGASPTLMLQIGFFGLAVVVLNLLPLPFLLASMRVAESAMQRLRITRLSYFLLAVLCLWTAALAFNKLYFPRSTFALLIPAESPSSLLWLGGVTLGAFIVLGIVPAAWRLLGTLAKLLKHPAARATLGVVLATGVSVPLYSRWSALDAQVRQPDIIIIGLDSVSPLHMQRHPGALPMLEAHFRQSTVFSQTLTPLARTFPAWTSILTANFPVHHGARFNLTHFDQVDSEATLPRLLKPYGYRSIYAQDERKFNNTDEQFGFDVTVGPSPGAAEFVLTTIADQPFLNLALLAPAADRLFPFIALNRAAPIHYDPGRFVDAIAEQLPSRRDQPLFLAAHFCLAHHPYTWRTQGRRSVTGEELSLEEKHVAALRELDRQIDRLLQTLKKRGRLDNAVLVFLSDHGESFGYHDGLWTSKGGGASRQDRLLVERHQPVSLDPGFSGHGSNVLERTQYQSILAFRAYGAWIRDFPSRVDGRLASLADVMPTLLQAVGVKPPADIDGISLLPKNEPNKLRVVPTETGIRFLALSSVVNINEDALLAEAKEYYQVDPTSARLIVKPERYASLVASKDIALHTDDWMLALLRKDGSPAFPRVALLVHKPSGAWTLGHDRGLVERAPMHAFRQSAKNLYGEEVADFAQTWAFR